MNNCPRFGKLIRGCNFEPRYDEAPPQVAYDFPPGTPLSAVLQVINATKTKTYVGEVCTSCGKREDK